MKEDHLRKLKLPSIEKRLCRGDMLETHKLLLGKVNARHEQFFYVEHQDPTRGHNQTEKGEQSMPQDRVIYKG